MLVNLLYALTVAIKKIVANGIQTLETPKTFGTKNEAKKNHSIPIRVLINNDYKYSNKRKGGFEIMVSEF